jgi:hypothetical protein
LLLYLHLLSAITVGFKLNSNLFHLNWNAISLITSKRLGWYTSGSLSKSKISPVSTNVFKPQSFVNLSNNVRPVFTPSSELWQLFLQAWGTFRPKGSAIYSAHRDFRLLFVGSTFLKKNGTLLSAGHYFARWVDSYNLLFNLFYSDASVQLMSNKLFIEESMIFNWHFSSKNYKLFKYIQPTFIFKDLTHGSSIHTSMVALFIQNLDLSIFVDIKNHQKLLVYLNKSSLYSIGLIPAHSSPWAVSYPIPSFADGALMQFYFIRWIFYIKNQSDYLRFSNIRNGFK